MSTCETLAAYSRSVLTVLSYPPRPSSLSSYSADSSTLNRADSSMNHSTPLGPITFEDGRRLLSLQNMSWIARNEIRERIIRVQHFETHPEGSLLAGPCSHECDAPGRSRSVSEKRGDMIENGGCTDLELFTTGRVRVIRHAGG